MTRSLYQVPYFELTCAPKHALPQHVFRSARRRKYHDWCLKKPKINVTGQGQPKYLNIRIALELISTDMTEKVLFEWLREGNLSLFRKARFHLNMSEICSNFKRELLRLKWFGNTSRQLTPPRSQKRDNPRLVGDCLVSIY